VAAGVALSFKLRKQKQVVICYTGDGATSRGDWHEGLNLAAVMNLPVVYVCVNNQFAYSTPLHRQLAVGTIAERASGYGMPVARVDGNDVNAVYDEAATAVERARTGGGPSFIEAVTFRIGGHSAADDASYMPVDFVETAQRNDPIERFIASLRAANQLGDTAIAEIDARIEGEVEAALQAAEKSPLPEGPEAMMGVYAE
jgi:TPP-dependent pyruvate/acetoin dehydrogenase alpha subunit